MKRWLYISLNICAALLIWHLLPEWFLSSILISKWGLLITKGTMQKLSLLLFLFCAIGGALIVPRKQMTIWKLAGNVLFPVLLLMTLRIAQYMPVQTLILLALVAVNMFLDTLDFRGEKRKARKKRLFMKWRTTMITSLLQWMVPISIIFVWQGGFQQEQEMQVLFRANEEKSLNELISLTGEVEWETFTLEERLPYAQAMADYECEKLGITAVNVYAVQYSDDKISGSYLHEFEAVFLNDQYLEVCGWKELVRVVAHEIYHRYEHVLIDSLELLEKKGFEYETLSYYQDAIILKEAKENYAEDLDSYETYIQNELEVQANVYADAEVGALSAIYGW